MHKIVEKDLLERFFSSCGWCIYLTTGSPSSLFKHILKSKGSVFRKTIFDNIRPYRPYRCSVVK